MHIKKSQNCAFFDETILEQAASSPIFTKIDNGKNLKVMHANGLRHQNVPTNLTSLQSKPSTNVKDQPWKTPTVDHVYVQPPAAIQPWYSPQQHHCALDKYGFWSLRSSFSLGRASVVFLILFLGHTLSLFTLHYWLSPNCPSLFTVYCLSLFIVKRIKV